MKYGESFFDIAYLITAIGTGLFLLIKGNGKLGMLMLPKTVCYVLILIAFLKKRNSSS